MNKIIIQLFISVVMAVTFLLTPVRIYGENFSFSDEFNLERTDNILDSTKWDLVTHSAGFATIKESQGFVNLTQEPGNINFPYVISKVPFNDSDMNLEVKFQYTGIAYWGSGLAFSDNPPTGPGPLDTFMVGVWQDRQEAPSTIPSMRVSTTQSILKGLGPNIDSHVLRVEYRSGTNTIFFDDEQIGQVKNNVPLRYFWMGSPYVLSGNTPNYWSSFKVDYVRVTTIPSSPVTTKTPVIFIPGFGGSELKIADKTDWAQSDGHGGFFTHTYQKDEKIWVNELEAAKPGNDDYFDGLRLKDDGKTDQAPIALTGDIYKGAYQKTIDYFTSKGYTLNKDFYIFPYDFRKDVGIASDSLGKKIEEIKRNTGNAKVDLVAHSMGGLVARQYISDTTHAGNVRKLISLGTPFLGTTKLLKVIMYGDCLKYSIGPVCLSLDTQELKDILQNSSGAYELAPSQSYFNFYNGSDSFHPVPFKDDRDIDNDNVTGDLNYSQTKSLLKNLGYNSGLFGFNDAYHSIDNNLSQTNGVDTTIIVGSGQPTIGQIVERNLIDFGGIKIPKKDLLMINGDDTTPLYSGSLNDPAKNLSLSGSSKVYYAKLSHELLPTNDQTLELVTNILDGSTSIPSEISTTPYQLNGTLLSVHSPVTLDVYDQNNNHTGINGTGDVEENIPGSFYTSLDDAKFVWIPDGKYTVKFTATDQGSFDYKVRKFNNDQTTETTIFQNVPLTITTKATTNLDTTDPQLETLNLDSNGDGNLDKTLSPTAIINGNEYDDHTPPEAKISYNLQTQDIEVIGEDNMSTVIENNNGNGQIVLKDGSGNTTTLFTDSKEKKKKDEIIVQSISYNQDPAQTPTDNQLVVTYKVDSNNKILQFDQTIIIKGEERLKAFFEPNTNKTKIITKENGQAKNIEFKDGTILLNLKTKTGNLITNY